MLTYLPPGAGIQLKVCRDLAGGMGTGVHATLDRPGPCRLEERRPTAEVGGYTRQVVLRDQVPCRNDSGEFCADDDGVVMVDMASTVEI